MLPQRSYSRVVIPVDLDREEKKGPGDVGPRPDWVDKGLSQKEDRHDVIYAGRKRNPTDKEQKDSSKWTVVPFCSFLGRANGSLFIRKLSRDDGTWRLYEISKGSSGSFHDFHSLENARLTYWDMVRGVLAWGTPSRRKELA